MLWTLKKYGPLEKVLEIVAQAGYTGVEMVGEWKSWTDADFSKFLTRAKSLGLTVDSTAGAHGYADAAAFDTVESDLRKAIEACKKLDCKQIILTSNQRTDSPTLQGGSIESVKRLDAIAAKAGVQIVLEPIDLLENPHAYLTSVTQAFEIVRAVDSPHTRVLYDIYHEQRQAGNLLEKIEKNIDLIGLFHIADVPGRHEPGTGEIRYEAIYRKIAELKYTGYIAMEFYPTGEPVATLRTAREQAIRDATMA
jgi:hydroxypyruvate isomerase